MGWVAFSALPSLNSLVERPQPNNQGQLESFDVRQFFENISKSS